MSELLCRGTYEGETVVPRYDTEKPETMKAFVFRNVRFHSGAWDGYKARFPKDKIDLLCNETGGELIPGQDYGLEVDREGNCMTVKFLWSDAFKEPQ